jgi:hypothetical protein
MHEAKEGSTRNHVRTGNLLCHKSSQRVVHAEPRRPWKNGFRRHGFLPAQRVHGRRKDNECRNVVNAVRPIGRDSIHSSNLHSASRIILSHRLITGKTPQPPTGLPRAGEVSSEASPRTLALDGASPSGSPGFAVSGEACEPCPPGGQADWGRSVYCASCHTLRREEVSSFGQRRRAD